MSLSLTLFVVDPNTVEAAIGSGDIRMRRAIGGRFKRDMAHADEYFEDRIADGAPTRYEALTAVVDGGPFEREHAFQYGYAYEMICAFHGRRQSNNAFSPFKFAWLEHVDKELASLGITVGVSEFGYGLPGPLPTTDLPGHGVWSAAECATALEQFEATTGEQLAALDPSVREAVEECAEWLRTARTKEGAGVVGFLS